MPKRSNDFQKLVTFIYERISPEGGLVTESGMVLDKEAGVYREVDILLENKIAGHNIKIAVECRDRSRKDSVEWIDGIIGKTKSLDVDKVVAVSSSGFSKTAALKAKANNIDLVTYKEASEINWEKYILKPGLALVSDFSYSLKRVLYWDNTEFKDIIDLNLDSTVIHDGQEEGNIKECFELLFKKHFIPFVETYLKNNRDKIFKTLADIKSPVYLEKEIHLPNLYAVCNDKKYDISRTKMIVIGTRLVKKLDLEHSLFNNKLISMASHKDKGEVVDFKMIHDPDTGKMHLNWKQVEPNENN